MFDNILNIQELDSIIKVKDYVLINREKKRPVSTYEKIIKRFSFLKFPAPSFIKKSYDYSIFHNKYNLTADQMFSAPINFILLGSLLSILIYFTISPLNPDAAIDLFYGLILTFFTLGIYLFIYPKFHEKIVKTIVTAESIWVLTFMVIYLRRIPNIEGAIAFVASYLDGYLPSEFADIIYDLNIKKYTDIEQAIRAYSKRWIEWNYDFAYAVTIILNIRHIPDFFKAQELLDKALEWFIKTSDNKIALFAAYLKPKVVIVAMFLIMLPIIGVTMLPVLAVFLPESVRITLIFYIYDVLLPIIAFLLVQMVISERPFSFQTPNLSMVPDLPKDGHFKLGKTQIKIFPIVLFIAIIFSIPSLIHLIDLGITMYRLPVDSPLWEALNRREYQLDAILTTYSMVLGIGLAVGLYFYLNSFQKIKKAKEIEEIEKEIPLTVTVIENTLYSGVPLERGIIDILKNYRIALPRGKLVRFLEIIVLNMYKFGMTLRDAIFDKKIGAIIHYPSLLLREVMNLIISASEKGIESIINVAKRISKHLDDINNLKQLMLSELSDSIGTLKIILYAMIPIFGTMSMLMQKFILQFFIILFDILKSFTWIGYGQSMIDIVLGELIRLDRILPVTVFIVPVGIFIIEISIITGYFLSGILYGFEKTGRDYTIGLAVLYNTIIITLSLIVGLMFINYLLTDVFNLINK